MSDYRFKIGIYLPELQLPFDEALAKAREIGAECVWFNRLDDEEKPIARLSDGEVTQMAERLAQHDLEIFLISAGSHFKQIHLTDLEMETLVEHPEFRREFDELVRAMQIAAELKIPAVNTFSFAWPGEYSAGKPTWPMRWLTRGGIIADVDLDKLVKAFSLVAEQAEHYNVDVDVSMMPWNYTNTTGNFRRLAERVGSPRLKVMWSPSDNINCGEADVATAGFINMRPYLYGLHLKDLRVNDGLKLDFDYCPIGEGDVDYPTILRHLRAERCDTVLSLSTHFRTPGGSAEEAMRINYANLKALIQKVEGAA